MKMRHSLKRSGAGLVICVLSLTTLGAARVRQEAVVPSEAEAVRLESKIRAIEAADTPGRTRRETVDVSEIELESYVLYGLAGQLPVQVETVDVELRTGQLAATVDMVVEEGLSASQPIAGPLFEGAHTIFFEGAFEARRGTGTFDLQGVRVDGIPVPVFLVKALLENLDEPMDLDAPFETPLGIDDVVVRERSVRVTY